MWILCQKEVMAKTKNLKVHHQFNIAPGVAQTSPIGPFVVHFL
jgi:hypothetical protein